MPKIVRAEGARLQKARPNEAGPTRPEASRARLGSRGGSGGAMRIPARAGAAKV